MKKKVTLNEQIKRMKQLGEYNKTVGKYQFLKEDAPIDVNGQPQAAPQQQPAVGNQKDVQVDQEIDKLFSSPEFNQQLQGAMNQATQALPNDLQQFVKTQGDRDGELDVQEGVGSTPHLNEAGLILAASMVLAAPKIAEYVGKGLNKLGVKASSETIQKMGEKLSHFGHSIHNKYIKGIEFAVGKVAPNLDEQKRHAVAEHILTMMVAGLGVASVAGVVHAVQAGHAGIAALETGLSGVKAAELAEKVRELLPDALLAAGAEAIAAASAQAGQKVSQIGQSVQQGIGKMGQAVNQMGQALSGSNNPPAGMAPAMA